MHRIVSIVVVVALALASVMTMAGVATAAAGSIAGYVYEEDGTTPISLAVVYAYEYSVDVTLGPTFAAGFDYTEIDGSYTILGLASGDYRVVAVMNGYFSEYYDDVASSADATAVSVTDPNPTTGIDFHLAVGGSISGFVYQDAWETATSA